jgi:DNA-binding HxlR family transcriptional regulator
MLFNINLHYAIRDSLSLPIAFCKLIFYKTEMRDKNRKRPSGCPIAFALDTFGDRWSLLIIREIMLKGNKTYSDFLASDEGIATNILVDRLKHLEAEGIITKTRDPENRRKFNYALTKKGLALIPVILEIVIWSGAYDDRIESLHDVLDKIQQDRAGFEASLRDGK